MTPAELVHECRRRGVELRRHPGGLGIKAFRRLPPELFEQLKRQKEEILTLLDGARAGLPDDQAAWLPTAQQVIGGGFDGGHKSLLESLLIGVRGIKHPLCVEVRARFETMLGKGR
jgi:hypothetical protein